MEMEDFKRPDHNDFATTSELRKREWSGVRSNSITQRIEIWVVGELKGEVSNTDEEGYRKLYAEIFGMNPKTTKFL